MSFNKVTKEDWRRPLSPLGQRTYHASVIRWVKRKKLCPMVSPGSLNVIKVYLNKHLYSFLNRKATARYMLSKSYFWHSASVLRQPWSNRMALAEDCEDGPCRRLWRWNCLLYWSLAFLVFLGHKIITFVLASSRETEPIVCVCVSVCIYVLI